MSGETKIMLYTVDVAPRRYIHSKHVHGYPECRFQNNYGEGYNINTDGMGFSVLN